MSENRARISAGQPGTEVGPGSGPVFEVVVDMSGKELTVAPEVFAVLSSDRLEWRPRPLQEPPRKFEIEFLKSCPFDPPGRGPRTVESDASGIVAGKIHPQASGQYAYRAVIPKDPAKPAEGLLLVNFRASIVVRGSTDPD